MPYVLKYMACVFCGVRMREGIVAVLERVHGIIFCGCMQNRLECAIGTVLCRLLCQKYSMFPHKCL